MLYSHCCGDIACLAETAAAADDDNDVDVAASRLPSKRGRDAAEAPKKERCRCSCSRVLERPWRHHDVSHREETLTLLLGDPRRGTRSPFGCQKTPAKLRVS